MWQFFICFLSLTYILIVPTVDCKKTTYLLNKPQCSLKQLDRIEMVMLKAAAFGPHGRKLPETFAQVKTFCKETNRMVLQIEAFFKDCFEKSVRDYASIVLYTIKSQLKKFCGKRGSKQVKELLKLAPCANKYIQPFDDDCVMDFMNKTTQLINIKYDRLKFPYLCCFFVDATRCGEARLKTISCMRSHVPMLMDLFRSGSQSLIDFGCGEYNDQTDACEKLGPPPKPTPYNKDRYAAVPFVLIDLLASIKDPSATPGFGV